MAYEPCTQTGGDFAAKLIENRVRSLAGLTGRWGLWPDDLRQELWAELSRKWPKYNPRRGSEHAFIRSVVNSKIAKLLEHAEAQCRDYRLTPCSLDEPASDADGTASTIGQLIDLDDLLPLVGLGGGTNLPIVDLKLDIEQALRELDAKEVALCNDLLELTILEISQLRGIPRGTIYEALRRIREKVAPILADYLPEASRQNSNRPGNRRGE
jgi:RNA polymerase sigma-70 factor (ECF subfamily)